MSPNMLFLYRELYFLGRETSCVCGCRTVHVFNIQIDLHVLEIELDLW